MFKPVRTNI